MTFFFGVSIIIEVDTTLNGDTVDITFYEDTDNDGSFENTEVFSVGTGINSFSPSSLLMTPGNDLYWRMESTDDGDVTTAQDNVTVTIEY